MIVLLACTAPLSGDTHTGAPPPEPVPWSSERPALDHTTAGGRHWKRGMIHLHSPYSHDACDNEPMVDELPREDCLADLRAGLCATAMDFAFLTDHPAHAAEQPYEDLLLSREGDTPVEAVVDGAPKVIGNAVPCDDRRVLLLPGIEDELMPVGLTRQVSDDPATADQIYNSADEATFRALQDAGALVLQAHTEERPLELLLERQAWGQVGVEMFNLHAMFDPDIRADSLGLDPYGYMELLAPFVTGETTAEPDLAFLAVLEDQVVTLERFDALNAVAGSVGTGGTDAHQNVFPTPASDGERLDSYRRMMSWFSNVLLVEGEVSPDSLRAALLARRNMVAFESLGLPDGWEVRYGDLEMGGDAPLGGELRVACPTLAGTSPQNGNLPEIRVEVLRDGAVWQEGCGAWTLDEPGVYRAVARITPHHLADFLGDLHEPLVHEYPWLYSNSFRVGL